MADDQPQRPYRSNEAPARGQPAKAAGAAPSSDPLAELARLIGQNDPFSEFGRDGAPRRAPPQPRQPEPAADWSVPAAHPVPQAAAAVPGYAPLAAAAAPPIAEPPMFGSGNFNRQPFGSAPLAAGGDLYQVENENAAYAEPRGGLEHDPYPPGQTQAGSQEDDYYEDVPSNRRRIGVMAIAGIFALAVIGTAGAFGYRALFGSSSSTSPPPVIKAETAPSKIVPATPARDPQSNKLIVDRVNERGQSERLVSREETPVAITERPGNIAFPQGQDANASSGPQLGSGVVGSEPKRVRTIAIHPDQIGGTGANQAPPPASPAQTQAPASAPAPARITSINPARQPAQPARVAPQPAVQAAADPEPPASRAESRAASPPPPVQRAAPPVRVAAAPPSVGNAPLSLSPEAAPPQPARNAPVARTASAPPPTRLAPVAAAASGAAGSYAVQVSSQRSEAEAQAAFQSLQGKFPGQLGGKQAMIRKVDLGEKGIYYRAMVGPFGSSGEAGQLCSNLKSAGGQCLVQKN